MKVLIIEDEERAARRLKQLIENLHQKVEVLDTVDSVKNAILWLTKNPTPDLLFMDIQLGDGISFEIFEVITINCPVIFTTAYDEYALKAFEVNSIDYLLKPIDEDSLRAAFNKLSLLKAQATGPSEEKVATISNMMANTYKNRFIIKIGEHIKSIPVKDILYFFSREKATFLKTTDGKNYLIDYALDKIEGMLEPNIFFRINRRYLIDIESIKDIVSYSNSRLKVSLKKNVEDDIIVSRDRVQDFKTWLGR